MFLLKHTQPFSKDNSLLLIHTEINHRIHTYTESIGDISLTVSGVNHDNWNRHDIVTFLLFKWDTLVSIVQCSWTLPRSKPNTATFLPSFENELIIVALYWIMCLFFSKWFPEFYLPLGSSSLFIVLGRSAHSPLRMKYCPESKEVCKKHIWYDSIVQLSLKLSKYIYRALRVQFFR